MELKFYVRTTGERQLDSSYSQIEYELLIDKEHKPVESFIKQLEIISDYNSVLLEDDLILCKDFEKRIKEVIDKYPNDIINFFTPNTIYKYRRFGDFAYNQCTYYPKGLAKIISKKMTEFNKKMQYDLLENLALISLNLTYIQYKPDLVQHIDFNSLIQKIKHIRRSIHFIDYLDELGITYNEAYKHKEELIKLMNSKFKEEEIRG